MFIPLILAHSFNVFMSFLGDKCPACGSENITDKMYGRIFILDIERSEIAKLMNAKVPGKYAVKVK